jgi:hypothetical protein
MDMRNRAWSSGRTTHYFWHSLNNRGCRSDHGDTTAERRQPLAGGCRASEPSDPLICRIAVPRGESLIYAWRTDRSAMACRSSKGLQQSLAGHLVVTRAGAIVDTYVV